MPYFRVIRLRRKSTNGFHAVCQGEVTGILKFPLEYGAISAFSDFALRRFGRIQLRCELPRSAVDSAH